MRAIAQNKLTKRLLLLFVLAGTLIYLKTPTKAHAFTCQQQCMATLEQCTKQCGDDNICIADCFDYYAACLKRCN